MEKKHRKICYSCKRNIADLNECKTDKYWTNNGDHILYHICPHCGKSAEKWYD